MLWVLGDYLKYGIFCVTVGANSHWWMVMNNECSSTFEPFYSQYNWTGTTTTTTTKQLIKQSQSINQSITARLVIPSDTGYLKETFAFIPNVLLAWPLDLHVLPERLAFCKLRSMTKNWKFRRPVLLWAE